MSATGARQRFRYEQHQRPGQWHVETIDTKLAARLGACGLIQRFRGDALRARRALAAVRPSSARGRRAKQLALAAFRDYTLVGRQWTLSGQARLRGRRLAAVGHARAAQKLARKANRLLVASGKLLR